MKTFAERVGFMFLTGMFLSLLIQPSFGGSMQEPEPSSAFAWEVVMHGGAVLVFHIDGKDVVFGHEETAMRKLAPECGTGMHITKEALVLCFGAVMYTFKRYPSYYRFKGGEWIDVENASKALVSEK